MRTSSRRTGPAALVIALSLPALASLPAGPAVAAGGGAAAAATATTKGATAARATVAPEDATTTFGFTGGTQDYRVPDGIRTLSVRLVGARGGGTRVDDGGAGSSVAGGSGALVSGPLTVVPGELLGIRVGGDGQAGSNGGTSTIAGGFNGGGRGSSFGSGIAQTASAAGGGATDVSRNGARIVVAGGGGGAGGQGGNVTIGGSVNRGGGGGRGGNAGNGGSEGQGTYAAGRGQGGAPGTSTAPGAGGAGGTEPNGDNGTAGQAGSGANGGAGSDGRSNTPQGRGGGGGGGLFGGGGGGSSTDNTGAGSPVYSGGGGGGGGASLPPSGGLAVNSGGEAAGAALTYQAPGTAADGPTGPVADPNPSYVLSSSGGEPFQCSVDGAAYATCPSPWTPGPLADGDHVLRARAVNSLGNADPTPAEARVSVDTRAPVASVTAGAAGPTASATSVFRLGADEAAVTFTCTVDGAPLTPCDPAGTTVGPLPDGAHVFSARATDRAGNTGAAATRAFTVDTVAPVTTISSGPTGLTTSARPAFAFTATETAVGFACRVDAAAYAPCVSGVVVGPLDDGAHVFSVRATDAAGNTGPEARRELVVDTAALRVGTVRSRRGTARVPVEVSGPGRVTVRGGGVRPAARSTATSPASTVLRVRPKGPLAQRVAATGRVVVKVRVRFTPTRGRVVEQRVRVVLRRG